MILNIYRVYRVVSQLKKLVNVGGGGENEEIKQAGVRAELGNINHTCVNISSVRWLEEDFKQELLLCL